MSRSGGILALLVVAAVALTGCSSSEEPPASTSATEPSVAACEDITVLAAASLTESFDAIIEDFEKAHDGCKVTVSYGASSTLALQVQEGSPADVLATADRSSMETALTGEDDADSVHFANNDLVIAVAKGNPMNITGLADLDREGVRVARCAPAVPCGKLADGALTAAGMTLTAATEGPDVKSTFGSLLTGEVDAALVYATDVLAAEDTTEAVALEKDYTQSTEYLIAALPNAAAPATADEFVEYITNGPGAKTIEEYGFSKP